MKLKFENFKLNSDGLIPAIVQDDRTGEVLMLAYMNEEAFVKTVETKETWFYSRSRSELWNKGATSGNRQVVKSLKMDCDKDTLLVQVNPSGPACHTGEKSCFSYPLTDEGSATRQVVHEVVDEIKERRGKPVEGSYTSYLLREGVDKILKKIGEEATEVVIGAKNADQNELTNELADLTYHVLVLMEVMNVTIDDVKEVLRDRRPTSEVQSNE